MTSMPMPMPNTNIAPKIASIDKTVAVITAKVDTNQEKALGLNKAPRVPKPGMPTHVAVEHGFAPPADKNSFVLGYGSKEYLKPN